ncbi:hypothetical protein [Thermosphaera aggregans]|uniref:Thioredoxin domain-containing protein n=1 Tax=Thermosphaera aggregans (strain DSM 11486 / M11TL) TaxID=633148 RepID=D5U164_THEAM|nr:hypothetical protein [Thermosphaera aggregans]ADG90864.1 hypothetical protein Tagg_0591 [Thermosphaera aggregans DSM 11486]
MDDELIELLKKLLLKPEKKYKPEVGLELDTIGPESPNGIYVYDSKREKWVLKYLNGEFFQPWEDGLFVIYFDNAKCPACRAYDTYWYPFVKLIGPTFQNSHYVIILCDWFAKECDSEIARGSFQKYDVHASPTTLLMYSNSGKIILQDKLEGVKRMDDLANSIQEFLDKVSKTIGHKRGESLRN